MRAGKSFLVGTGDVGGVYRARAGRAPSRRATCRACSTASSGRAGASCAGTARAGSAFETRSGNTAKPDATWSALRGARSRRADRRRRRGPGRRARPRATCSTGSTFGAADARLRRRDARLPAAEPARPHHRDRRRRQRRAGGLRGARGSGLGALAGAAATPAPPAPHSAVLKLRWKVENPDGDELTYRLAFREENEAVWRPLGGPDPLTKTELRLEHRGAPRRQLRRARGRQRRALASRATAALDVDAHRRRRSWSTTASPRWWGWRRKYPFVSGRARDDQSPLTGARVRDRRRRLAACCRRPTASATTCVEAFTLKLPSAGRPARTRSPCAPGTAPTTWAPPRSPSARHDRRPGRDDAGGARRRPPACRPAPEVVQIEVGLLQNFCEILYCPETARGGHRRPGLGGRPPAARGRSASGPRITTALITHTHNDHIEGVERARAPQTGAAVVVNPREADGAWRRPGPGAPCAGRRGRRRRHRHRRGAACARWRRPATPSGGTCYLADGYVVTGDVLFVGGCGRTDFPGGDTAAMWRSLQRLMRAARGDARLPGPRLRRDADLDHRPRAPHEPVPALRDLRGVPRAARAQARGLSMTAPDRAPPAAASERLIVFLVGAVQFVNILDFMMVMPLGPDFAEGARDPAVAPRPRRRQLHRGGGGLRARRRALPRSLRSPQGAGRARCSAWSSARLAGGFARGLAIADRSRA